MKVYVVTILLMIFATNLLVAQQYKFLADDHVEYRKLKLLSVAFFDAVKQRDSLNMATVLAEEFTLTSSESNGEFLNREMYINGSLRPDILTVISFNQYDFKIRLYDQMAVVQSRINWQSEYLGKPWNADFLITDIFIYREDRWQIVHRHSSYPANYLSAAVKMRER